MCLSLFVAIAVTLVIVGGASLITTPASKIVTNLNAGLPAASAGDIFG